MPGQPTECSDCGGRLFSPIWGVRMSSDEQPNDGEGGPPDSHPDGKPHMRREGFQCVECGSLQLTREIPEVHAENNELGLPDSADRDFVREE